MKINKYFIGLGIPSIYGFVIFCVIAIRFDYLGLGILSTTFAIVLILSLIINFGTSPKIIRVCANSDGNFRIINSELTNSYLIILVFTFLVFILYNLATLLDIKFFDMGYLVIVKIIIISFLTAFNKNINATYIGLNHDDNFFISSIIRSTAVLIFVIFGTSNIYNLITDSLLFGEILYFLYWLVSKDKTSLNLNYLDKTIIEKQLKFGLKHLPTSLSDEALYRIDILMIAYFKGAVVVGIYSIISMGLEVLRELARTTFVSRSSYIVEKNDYFSENEKSSTISTLLKVATLLFILGLAGSSIGIDLLKALTNLEIQNDTKLYLFIFSTITALLSSNTFLKEVLPHLNLPGVNSIISIISLVINVALNFYLIPRFDILGALLSSTFSVLIALILRIILLRKNLN